MRKYTTTLSVLFLMVLTTIIVPEVLSIVPNLPVI